MLDFLLVKILKPSQNLLCIVLYSVLVEKPIFRQNVCQTGLHLLEVDAEELVQQLAAVELYQIWVRELLVLLNFVLK